MAVTVGDFQATAALQQRKNGSKRRCTFPPATKLCFGTRLLPDPLRPVKHLDTDFFLLVAAAQPILVGGLDEGREQRMRLQRLRLEFGMELAAEEEWMVGNLDDLDVGSVGCGAGDAQAAGGKGLLVFAVELVAMAVALADLGFAVRLMGQRAGLELAGPGAQPHGAAQFFHAAQLAQLVDDAVRSGRIEFAGVRLLQAADVARVFDARRLHAQADAEIRNLLLAGVLNSFQHAFDAALAESAGNQDAVHVFQLRLHGLVAGLETLGFDPVHVELEVVGERAMHQRFLQRLVGIFVLDILADDANGDFVLRVVDAVDQLFPAAQVGISRLDVQVAQGQLVDAFMGEHQRHFVDGSDVLGGNDGFVLHVAEEGDFALELFRQEAVGAAEQNVGLNADAQQFFDRVLRGLGLQLAGGGDVGHQGDVDEERVLAAQFLAHLADGFDKGQRLDIADGAADFDDGKIDVLRDLLHRRLDLVGDVRNDLHRLAEIVAATLLGDDGFVDAAGGPVVLATQLGMGESLVVAEVEIGLGAVVGDEDLAVLERRHGSGIDVQIGIELLQRDLQPAAFHEAADGGRRQSLAQ